MIFRRHYGALKSIKVRDSLCLQPQLLLQPNHYRCILMPASAADWLSLQGDSREPQGDVYRSLQRIGDLLITGWQVTFITFTTVSSSGSNERRNTEEMRNVEAETELEKLKEALAKDKSNDMLATSSKKLVTG